MKDGLLQLAHHGVVLAGPLGGEVGALEKSGVGSAKVGEGGGVRGLCDDGSALQVGLIGTSRY
ncbi:hypothetical protein [Kitasatospora sp. NPDC058046]|uniref:hypothetical protein n=1 Tax=Kitasatospora sp. NPDC058046 TaxID=3346312 RepID=UPI0036DC1677